MSFEFQKAEIGKLYRVTNIEVADEFFRETEPIKGDPYRTNAQRVFKQLKSAERAFISQSILMLVKVVNLPEYAKAQYEFLLGSVKYITAPLYPTSFGSHFKLVNLEDERDDANRKNIQSQI
jgi:hypothetical protein